MAWPLIVAAGVAAAGSIAAKVMEGMSQAKQRELLQQATDQYGNIDMPALERIVAEQIGPSEFEKIKSDPSLRQAQIDSLSELKRIYSNGGRTLQDEANLTSDMNRSAQLERSARDGIRDTMNARGTMGGGSELMMRLSAAGEGANRNAQSALQSAAQREGRASESIMRAGSLGGQIRGQDFSEASRKAEAADARERYNADARQKAAYYNAGLPQQQFDNRMRVASGKANALGGQANQEGQGAQRNAQFVGGVTDAGVSIANNYYGQQREDERAAKYGWGGR